MDVTGKNLYLCTKRLFMEAMTLPKQLLVTVDGNTNIANVTRAIRMLRGVTSIKSAKPTVKKPRLYDPETGKFLNEKTMKIIEDVRSGKEPMYEMKSMEEFKTWCEAL